MSVQLQFPASETDQYAQVDVSDSKQSWIWAVGPKTTNQEGNDDNSERKRDNNGETIDQHSAYGK